jgi:hypothetical protein
MDTQLFHRELLPISLIGKQLILNLFLRQQMWMGSVCSFMFFHHSFLTKYMTYFSLTANIMNAIASDSSSMDIMVEEMKPPLRVAIARIFNQLIRYGIKKLDAY